MCIICVNVCCTAATGCQPNCGIYIYHIVSYHTDLSSHFHFSSFTAITNLHTFRCPFYSFLLESDEGTYGSITVSVNRGKSVCSYALSENGSPREFWGTARELFQTLEDPNLSRDKNGIPMHAMSGVWE
jgi:hypothetical protein